MMYGGSGYCNACGGEKGNHKIGCCVESEASYAFDYTVNTEAGIPANVPDFEYQFGGHMVRVGGSHSGKSATAPMSDLVSLKDNQYMKYLGAHVPTFIGKVDNVIAYIKKLESTREEWRHDALFWQEAYGQRAGNCKCEDS